MVVGMLLAQVIQGGWLLGLYVFRLRDMATERSGDPAFSKSEQSIINAGLSITTEPVP
jgi:hypothetical protein